MIARITMVVALTLALASCGGDGVIDRMVTEPPPTSGPTLSSLQASIFTPLCTPGCHSPGGQYSAMDLSAGKTYQSVVGVPSDELAGVDRVAPGSAVDSYLYLKIVGDPIAAPRMPLDGPYLAASQIEEVRAWIEAGAKND